MIDATRPVALRVALLEHSLTATLAAWSLSLSIVTIATGRGSRTVRTRVRELSAPLPLDSGPSPRLRARRDATVTSRARRTGLLVCHALSGTHTPRLVTTRTSTTVTAWGGARKASSVVGGRSGRASRSTPTLPGHCSNLIALAEVRPGSIDPRTAASTAPTFRSSRLATWSVRRRSSARACTIAFTRPPRVSGGSSRGWAIHFPYALERTCRSRRRRALCAHGARGRVRATRSCRSRLAVATTREGRKPDRGIRSRGWSAHTYLSDHAVRESSDVSSRTDAYSYPSRRDFQSVLLRYHRLVRASSRCDAYLSSAPLTYFDPARPRGSGRASVHGARHAATLRSRSVGCFPSRDRLRSTARCAPAVAFSSRDHRASYGHDSFLLENGRMTALSGFLGEELPAKDYVSTPRHPHAGQRRAVHRARGYPLSDDFDVFEDPDSRRRIQPDDYGNTSRGS